MAYITLNQKAFFYNLDIITQKACDINKVALVLKDNAYGHGLLEVAQMAREYGIVNAIVRDEAEAKIIEEYFQTILILADKPSYKNAFIYTINSLSDIEKMQKGTRVVLKVDSGMHRNGICSERLEEAFDLIAQKELHLHSVMTHHRAADTLSSEFFWQEKQWQRIKYQAKTLIQAYNFKNVLFHSQNSAALFRNAVCEDFVRVGIAAYGCLEMDVTLNQPQLKPIMSLYAKKMATRHLKKGEGAGYNAIEKASKDMVVSTYDFGYADGFYRSLSAKFVNPEGKKVFGRISMDNASFEGDAEEILIFNDANAMAKQAQTIAYEVMVRLPSTMQRVTV